MNVTHFVKYGYKCNNCHIDYAFAYFDYGHIL